MFNFSNTKTIMPCQKAESRITNFDEVSLGYCEEDAVKEAERCLNCPNSPCRSGCPVGVDISAFIRKVAQRQFLDAYEVICATNALPAICGRVCPQESQCEMTCVRGKKGEPVAIGRLERFVADWYREHNTTNAKLPTVKKQKVAVVGSGPSALTCASYLNGFGYAVEIFEALHCAGGVLTYGIPEFRLPKSVVADEVKNLTKNGVIIHTNVVIGKTLTVEDLKHNGFSAVYIASGAGLPKFMNIEGENLNGVYSANEYLCRINLMKGYASDSLTPVYSAKKVVVVGGGNVAMDSARCAKRLGAEVHVVYRRSEVEMPARREEIEHAKQEGIVFDFLTNPIRIIGNTNNKCSKIECVKMQLIDDATSHRRKPVVVEGSNFTMDVDCVIMALGTTPNPLIVNTTSDLVTESWGGIVVDANGRTSLEGVFAGGDAVTGSATVISAMGAGKTAAIAIDEYVKSKTN